MSDIILSNEEIEEYLLIERDLKESYEASLGRFLVEFNRIEIAVSQFIRRKVAVAGLSHLGSRLADESFGKRLLLLQDLAKDIPELSNLPFKDIREASENRNNFAHGNLDINPFDGTFDITGKRTLFNQSIEVVEGLADTTEELAVRLETALMVQWQNDRKVLNP